MPTYSILRGCGVENSPQTLKNSSQRGGNRELFYWDLVSMYPAETRARVKGDHLSSQRNEVFKMSRYFGSPPAFIRTAQMLPPKVSGKRERKTREEARRNIRTDGAKLISSDSEPPSPLFSYNQNRNCKQEKVKVKVHVGNGTKLES